MRQGVLPVLLVLFLSCHVQCRDGSFDDDMAATLSRAEEVHDILEKKLPEEMGLDDEMRMSSEANSNPVDEYIWQTSNMPRKVPIPAQILPQAAEVASHEMFRHLFTKDVRHKDLSYDQVPTLSLEKEQGADSGGRITRRPKSDSEHGTATLVQQPTLPNPPDLPNAAPTPPPALSSLPNQVTEKLNQVQLDVFNQLYTNAYGPGEMFVQNAIKDLEEMWQAANGNQGKQILVAEVANEYILPAVSGIWPALFYYHLSHIAVKQVAPSWWPQDPFPNVPASKKLPDVAGRRGIPGASEVMNRQLGLNGGNLKHHCELNNMLDCID